MVKPGRILPAVGLALILAVGFATVFAVVIGWTWSIWEGLARRGGVNESLVVRADGPPLIHRYTNDGYFEKSSYHTLDGKDVTSDPKNEGHLLIAASLTIPDYHMAKFPLAGRQRIGRFSDGENVLWYFADDGARDGRGYFVGYHIKNKLLVGFIGRSGFRQDQPPVDDWFPMDGVKLQGEMGFVSSGRAPYWYPYQSYYNNLHTGDFPEWKVEMISGEQLLRVDLRDKSVTKLMDSPDLISGGILGVFALDNASKSSTEESPLKPGDFHEYLAVRMPDRVVLLDAAGKQHSAYVIPKELRDRDFSIYETGKDAALLTYGAGPGKSSDTNVEKLVWIDAAGKISLRAEAELHGVQRVDEHQEAWLTTAVVPSPIALGFIAAVAMPLEDMDSGKQQGYFTRVAHHLAVYAVPLLLTSLFSAVLAFLCWRRNRRFCQPASVVWLVFVLVAGLPGLVGYLFHRRWPVLEACPACMRNVPRDRDACAACGAEFPPPQPKGIEVFA